MLKYPRILSLNILFVVNRMKITTINLSDLCPFFGSLGPDVASDTKLVEYFNLDSMGIYNFIVFLESISSVKPA